MKNSVIEDEQGRIHGQTDGWTDGWMDRQTDGWTNKVGCKVTWHATKNGMTEDEKWRD